MEQSKRSGMKFIGVLVGYILLSALGVFQSMGTVLFPLLALPFTLYCMRNKVATTMHMIFHIIISIVIYLLMGNPYCILIYCIAVAIPTYMILFLYKQEISIPNMIMYMGLSLSVFVFAFFILMKSVGIDFEAQFVSMLTEVNQTFVSAMDYTVQANTSASIDTVQLQEAAAQMKQTIAQGIEALKIFYPAIMVSQIVISSAVTIILFNTIVRRKNKALPSNKELLEFRVSKVAIVLLMCSMLMGDLNVGAQGTSIILGLNIMCFLMNLLQVVGTLGLIALLKKTSVNSLSKGIGYVAIVFLFIFFPYITMFFGCLDAIFNYRKVKIVV